MLTLLIGCATAPPSAPSWIAAHGGLLEMEAGPQRRVHRAVAGLLDGCTGRPVRVRVLDSPNPCAYAWPTGEIYLTRGLVELLDDAEIAAAVAHELGHLLHDGHVRSVVSLRGEAGPADVESRADLLGLALLESRGVRANAMPSMLRKIAAWKSLPPHTRRALHERIGALLRLLPAPR